MFPTLAFGYGDPHDTAILLFVLLLLALPTAFWLVELVDAARRQFPDQSIKVIWLAVILFTHFIGAAIYYFVGKKQGTIPSV